MSRSSDALTARALTQGAFTNLCLGLGAVAVLVGAVGIGNVMVISVLERRSEVGLRRALGAKRLHIAVQFLTESVFDQRWVGLRVLPWAPRRPLPTRPTRPVAGWPYLRQRSPVASLWRSESVPGRVSIPRCAQLGCRRPLHCDRSNAPDRRPELRRHRPRMPGAITVPTRPNRGEPQSSYHDRTGTIS